MYLINNFFYNYIYMYYLLMDLILFILMIIPTYLIKFHPLILSLLLTLYTIILVMKLNYLNNLYWYSYILYLIMVGGILILFMYLTSISNNELLYLNKKYYMNFMIKMMLILFIYLMMIKYMKSLNFLMLNYHQDILNIMKINKEFMLDYKNLYMKINMDIMIYMILYLFFIMVISVLICMKNFMPLRQMINYE
uniref:NADH dehydrogenase subunit 6 n=1 Tax=Eumacrocentrus sp. QL-2013 TaxID=1421594 RepID=A0A0A6ZLU1_9HYME|nr:NADH dehydrogenase subunit 6 [Eumacrocentrus sp. QL-2013]